MRRWLFRYLLLLIKIRFHIVWWLGKLKSGVFTLGGPEPEPGQWSKPYRDRYFICSDRLRLHFRDYTCEQTRATVLCLHGLTRNAADFDEIATLLCRRYRVIALDMRGRGLSEYDLKTGRYRPDVYVQDTWQLIKTLELTNVILLGTSMGALMSIMLAALIPARLSAMILNEAGPVVEEAGLAKIGNYLKRGRLPTSWEDATQLCEEMYSHEHPNFNKEEWRAYAKKTWLEDANGNPATAYDYAIATLSVAQVEQGRITDIWPIFDLTGSVPVLVLRGAISEVLSQTTVEEMCQRHPACRAITVPGVGHAPTLNEPACRDAVVKFIEDNC